jgi:hypothetical protein
VWSSFEKSLFKSRGIKDAENEPLEGLFLCCPPDADANALWLLRLQVPCVCVLVCVCLCVCVRSRLHGCFSNMRVTCHVYVCLASTRGRRRRRGGGVLLTLHVTRCAATCQRRQFRGNDTIQHI